MSGTGALQHMDAATRSSVGVVLDVASTKRRPVRTAVRFVDGDSAAQETTLADEVEVATPPAVGPSPRLGGVDAARALAIVGMVAVHFAPRPLQESGLSAWLLGVPYGKASVLFALVAGVGVSLLAQRKADTLRLRLLYRTAWLFPVGMVLQTLDHPVAVILHYYAVWFAIAAIFVHTSDRGLLWWSAGWLAVGSLGVAWLGVAHRDWLLVARGNAPGGAIVDILFTGYYPTLTWVPVVLFGMWLGRRDLAVPREWVRLVGGGVAVMAVAFRGGLIVKDVFDVRTNLGTWGRLLSIDGHSEMPLAVVGSVGLATAVLGLCLWFVASLPRVSRPLVAMGQGALTLYVGHLVLWHFQPDLFPSFTVANAWTVIGWFTLVSAVGMTIWLVPFRRGPLEMLVRGPWHYAVEPMARIIRGEALMRIKEPEG